VLEDVEVELLLLLTGGDAVKGFAVVPTRANAIG